MIGALVVAVAMGLLVERLIIRPLFDAAPRDGTESPLRALASSRSAWRSGSREAKLRRISPALPRFDRVSLLGVQLSDQRLLLLVVLVVLGIVLALFFSRTNLGLAILGASQDAMATELAGISVRRLSSFTWALAALLGGLAGILAAPIQGNFSPEALSPSALIPGFTAAVLGRMNSLPERSSAGRSLASRRASR